MNGRRIVRILAASIAGAAVLAGAHSAHAQSTAQREAGDHAGIWFWSMPDAPDGTVPKQSWSGPGPGPNGEIYVAGMDHVANSILYRLGTFGAGTSQPADTLWYAGDARAASAAAGNLETDEPIEKFHTQPTLLNSRVYVGNLNYSTLDDGYLDVRGFHWYAYDRPTKQFLDLTAGKPGGVAIPHGGLVGMVADAANNRLYGAVAPTGELVRYAIGTGVTTNLGRPPAIVRPYMYPGRAMWVSSRGRVYFTAGNPNTGPSAGGPYKPAVFNHVRYWDPKTGFGEEKSWLLTDTRAIDFGQCFPKPAPRTCYLMDNVGHIYRYRETATNANWVKLGGIGQVRDELYGMTWVFQVSPDQRKAYVVSRRGAFVEFDLIARKATLRGNLWTLEPSLAGLDFYGNSTWDRFGRFYFSAFPKLPTDEGRARLVAISPALFLPAIL